MPCRTDKSTMWHIFCDLKREKMTNFIMIYTYMKKNLFLFGLILMGFLMTSCQSKMARTYGGDYSYNTSGVMNIYQQKDTIHVTYTERGSMRIIPLAEDDNKVMIVRTSLDGKVSRMNGTFVGDELVIKPYECQVNYAEYEGVLGNMLSTKTETIRVDCEGEVYHSGNDVTIVLTETYTGEHVRADKVMTVAEKY